MPLTLLQQPTALSLSRNRMPVVFQTDNDVELEGQAAVNQITITQKDGTATYPFTVSIFEVVAGTVILIKYAGRELPLTAGIDFPPGTISTAYIASLVPYFKQNYQLAQDFNITAAGDSLIFTAKTNKYGLDFAYQGSSTIVVSNTAAGRPEVKRQNYGIFFQLFIQKNGTSPVKIYENKLPVRFATNGHAAVDIADKLEYNLDHDMPNFAAVFSLCNQSAAQYFFAYAEVYGETPEVQTITNNPAKNVVMGGLSNLALAMVPDPHVYIEKTLLPHASLYKFQRWYETFPIEVFDVKTNQPQFLYFINSRSMAEAVALQVMITYTDATTQDVSFAGPTMQPFQKVAVGCGYQQLELPGKNTLENPITSYTVRIVSTEGEARTLTKTFILNRDYEAYSRYFLYADSAGNFKTLRTHGQAETSADIEFKRATKLEDQSTPHVGNIQRFDITSTEKETINTGFVLSRADYDALKEFTLSPRAFRVFGTTLVPINIISKSFDYAADQNNVSSAKIEYELAFTEQLYTADSFALQVPALNRSQQNLNAL